MTGLVVRQTSIFPLGANQRPDMVKKKFFEFRGNA